MKFLIVLFGAATLLSAQAVLDNDQVRVLKVLEQPHLKTKLHKHDVNRVMIYLQAGKQEFDYQGEGKQVLTFQANEAKWSPAGRMHIAQVTTDQPVTIVEIELKKPASMAKATSNPLDPAKIDPKHYRVAFENDQVRVLRVGIGAHEQAPMHLHALNRVVVYLTDQKIRVTGADGKEQTVEHKAGDIGWAAPAQHREENLNGVPFDLYAVELKD